MYDSIRCVAILVLIVFTGVMIKKLRGRKKSLAIAQIALSALLFTLITFPFERFRSFPSAEQAFQVGHLGIVSVELVVEGDDYDFVVGKVNGSYNHSVLPKSKDGWKPEGFRNSEISVVSGNNGILITIDQPRESSEVFLYIRDMENKTCSVADREGTVFISLEREGRTCYYAHLSATDPDYWIEVNGTVIKPFEAAPSGD